MKTNTRLIGLALLALLGGCIDGGPIFDSDNDAGGGGGGDGGGGNDDGGDPGQQPEEMRRTCRSDLVDVAVLPEGLDPELLVVGEQALYLNARSVERGEDELSAGAVDWVRLELDGGAILGEGTLELERSAMDVEALALPGGDIAVVAGGNGLLDVFVLPAEGEARGPYRPMVVSDAEWVPHVTPMLDEESGSIELFVMRADELLGPDTRIERLLLGDEEAELAPVGEVETVVAMADEGWGVDWLSPMEAHDLSDGRTLLFGRRHYVLDGSGAIEEVGDHARLSALRVGVEGSSAEEHPFADELMANYASIVEGGELWVASARIDDPEAEEATAGLVWSVLSAAGELVTERPLEHPDGRVPPAGLGGGPINLAINDAGELVVGYLAGHERNYVFHVLIVDPISGQLVDDGVVDFSGARFRGCQVVPLGEDVYWYLLGRTTASSDGSYQLREGYCTVDY